MAVAVDDEPLPDVKLVIVADARPARMRRHGLVVAANEVLAAAQQAQRLPGVEERACEIPEVSDLVLVADHGVPALDQHRIHLTDRSERSAMDVDRAMIAEMRVAGEEGCHERPTRGQRGRAPLYRCHHSGVTRTVDHLTLKEANHPAIWWS